jgi:hypothetical protein
MRYLSGEYEDAQDFYISLINLLKQEEREKLTVTCMDGDT